MKKLIAHYKKEDGVVVIIVVFLMVVLMGFTSFAMDMGMAYYKKSQLQTALDSAAIAACYKLPDINLATAAALDYLVKNGFPTTGVQITFQNNNKSVTLASSGQVQSNFANVFGIATKTFDCLAQATTTTKPIAGAAFGFAIYSGNRYPQQPCFSPAVQNECRLSGISVVVDGSVHANYNVNAAASFILEVGEAVGTVTGANIATKVSGAPYIPMPDFSIYKPQMKADAIAAGLYFSGNFTSTSGQSILITKCMYVEGDANLSGVSFSGSGCIYAGGRIKIAGSDTSYASTSVICIYSGYTSPNRSDFAIDFAGNSKDFVGMLYAPNGSISVGGGNYDFTGCVIGAVVQIGGSNMSFSEGDVSEGFKYASTSAYVLTK